MKTTPVTLAHQQCANHQAGDCLGLDFRKDGTMYRFRQPDRCVLGQKLKCSYFESAVLPMRKLVKDEYVAKQYASARTEYLCHKKAPETAEKGSRIDED